MNWVKLSAAPEGDLTSTSEDAFFKMSKYFEILQNMFWWIGAYPACALRALGLLLADSALTVGRGKTF